MKYYIELILILVSCGLYSQEIIRTSISSGGAYIEVDDIGLSQTIGQAITNTALGPIRLTQGFQQPDEIDFITGTRDIGFDIDLFLYPNPANQILHYTSGNITLSGAHVYNIEGKWLAELQVEQNAFYLQGFPTGVYSFLFFNEVGLVDIRNIVITR